MIDYVLHLTKMRSLIIPNFQCLTSVIWEIYEFKNENRIEII